MKIAAAASLVCFLSLCIPASAEEPGGVALLVAPEGVPFREWRTGLESRGIVLRHAFPPAGGLLVEDGSGSTEEVDFAVPAGTLVFHESPSASEAGRLVESREGELLWHAHRALLGLEGPFSEEGDSPGSPLVDDALEPPGPFPEVACSASSLYRNPSEYMLGAISVTVILPESTGTGTENWTATLETNVSNEIVQGCNDLSAYYNRNAFLIPTWTYHYILGRTDVRAQVAVEPISGAHPTTSACAWVDTIYNALGYSADPSCIEKGRHHNGDVRTADGTDWAYEIFVVNSLADGDGLFSDSYFGYAYLGGPFVMMTYDNDGWGIGSMNKVTRHESSHIFYALDEYSSSPCTCTEYSGYEHYQNQNCNKSCPSNVDCIMNDAARQQYVCAYTGGMIGWGDTDSDTIPDPVDIEPLTSLTAYSPDPTTNTTLTYTGTASIQSRTNQNIYNYRCDQNVLDIANVQWRVDGGSWSSASPSDGAFNSKSEPYNFTTGALALGTHTIETRAVDGVGQVDSTPASDSVTVQAGPPPGVPNGTSGTAMKGVRVDSLGNMITVTWDNACAAPRYEILYGGGSQLPPVYAGPYVLAGSVCNIGTGPSYSWNQALAPASDPRRFYWWLVVATNGSTTEGSWGKNSGSIERAGTGSSGSSGQCGVTGKTTTNTCGTP